MRGRFPTDERKRQCGRRRKHPSTYSSTSATSSSFSPSVDPLPFSIPPYAAHLPSSTRISSVFTYILTSAALPFHNTARCPRLFSLPDIRHALIFSFSLSLPSPRRALFHFFPQPCSVLPLVRSFASVSSPPPRFVSCPYSLPSFDFLHDARSRFALAPFRIAIVNRSNAARRDRAVQISRRGAVP